MTLRRAASELLHCAQHHPAADEREQHREDENAPAVHPLGENFLADLDDLEGIAVAPQPHYRATLASFLHPMAA